MFSHRQNIGTVQGIYTMSLIKNGRDKNESSIFGCVLGPLSRKI